MNAKIQCAAPHCRRILNPDPRVKNQRYCGEKACQRARKRQWQKEKLAVDPDYKAISVTVRLSGIDDIQAIIRSTAKSTPVIANVTPSSRPAEMPRPV